MLSDVLVSTDEKVRKYLGRFPEVYLPYRDEISSVMSALFALRVILDAAPEQEPSIVAALDKLRRTVRAINADAIQRALTELTEAVREIHGRKPPN